MPQTQGVRAQFRRFHPWERSGVGRGVHATGRGGRRDVESNIGGSVC